jgi:hypothetical protein
MRVPYNGHSRRGQENGTKRGTKFQTTSSS